MILDFKKISTDIQEILDNNVLAKETTFALNRIKSITNNPFISEMYQTNVNALFGTEEIEGKEHLTLTLGDTTGLYEGMVLSINKTKKFNGEYVIKSINSKKVIFENESPIKGLSEFAKVSLYVLDLPMGIELVVARVIDENRIHMFDSAGVQSIGQGSDNKIFKEGSTLRNYINTELDGYFMQPQEGRAIIQGFLSIEEEINNFSDEDGNIPIQEAIFGDGTPTTSQATKAEDIISNFADWDIKNGVLYLYAIDEVTGDKVTFTIDAVSKEFDFEGVSLVNGDASKLTEDKLFRQAPNGTANDRIDWNEIEKFLFVERDNGDTYEFAEGKGVVNPNQVARMKDINNVDLSDYYTKTEVDDKDTQVESDANAYTDQKISEIPTTDLSDYYTKSETDSELNDKVDKERVSTINGSRAEIVNTIFSSGDSGVWMGIQRPDGDVDVTGANRVEVRLHSDYSGVAQALIRASDADDKPITYVPDNGNSITTKDYVDGSFRKLAKELGLSEKRIMKLFPMDNDVELEVEEE